MRVARAVLIVTALAIQLTGCGKGSSSTGSLTVQLPEHSRIWRWQVVKAGSPDKIVQSVTDGSRTVAVAPGNYQVAIQHDQYFSGRVVWPQIIRVKRNQQATVSIQSGINLQVPENVRIWRWQVVKAGSPDEVVQWTTSDLRTLLVPPGDYQLTLQQDEYFSGRVVWPDRIQVTEGQTARVSAMSRVSLQAPENIRIWRWQVVKAGSPDEVVQWTTTDARTLLVPPGDYQVAIQHDKYFSGRVVWPAPVRVEKDQPAEVALQSGIKITVRAKSKIWRWQVVKAGSTDEVVQWTTSELRTLLVPPGEYQVVVQPEQYKSATVLWPQEESLVVSDGQITQTTLNLIADDSAQPSG